MVQDLPDKWRNSLQPPKSVINIKKRKEKRAVVDKFQLVSQHLLVLVKGSIGECRLWARPYFSSSVLHVLSNLDGF